MPAAFHTHAKQNWPTAGTACAVARFMLLLPNWQDFMATVAASLPPSPAWHFRGKLLLAWAIVLLGALGLTAAGFIAADRSVTKQLQRTRAELSESTRQVVEQLRAVAAADSNLTSLSAGGGALLDLHLSEQSGVEGGVWDPDQGFSAYVYPTYDGSTPKTQLPAAELPRLEALARRALQHGTLEQDVVVGEREALIRVAMPVPGTPERLVVWTMKRVQIAQARLLTQGSIAAGALLLIIVLTGLWLAWFLSRWHAALRQLRTALSVRPVESLPQVPSFDGGELDEIGAAINALSADLRASKAHASNLAGRLSGAERLAAVGRVSAALAHEIRNPIATIRLRAENAIANPGASSQATLTRILEEVERLDRLVRSLLELGRDIQLHVEHVDLREWSKQLLDSAKPRASAAGVAIEAAVDEASWMFDRVHLGRAVEALLANAIQFAPADSTVDLTITRRDDHLRITVSDTGPGITAEIEARLFTPFFTTRPDGNGLGLALAREIAELHGGTLRVARRTPGACFEMSIPWVASS